jgi:hypothetical protein
MAGKKYPSPGFPAEAGEKRNESTTDENDKT